MAPVMNNLRAFLKVLQERGLLKVIDDELDPQFEIPNLHLRVIDRGGPALMFRNPKGSKVPLVTNLFGTQERVDLAFGNRPKQFIQDLVGLADDMLPPSMGALWKGKNLAMQGLKVGMKKVAANKAPIASSGPRPPCFDQLPITTSWPEDGGPFITLPLVYTEHPRTGHHNLGMYRIHIYDQATTGMHWQIHKGGGFHYHEAEKLDMALPVTLFNGGPPALILAAIAPLPEDIPELLLASLLMGQKLGRVNLPGCPHPLIAEAEYAFVGEVRPHERRPEGPFGDHYGYYSHQHDYPVFRVRQVYHRPDPIFSATVVGEPRQEDFFIGDYLQDLLSPLFPKVMPSVQWLTTYGETGFHCLAAARVKVRYPREAVGTGHRILGEGQLSLTKVLMVSDADMEPRPFYDFLEGYLSRMDMRTDVHILSCTSQDTLDYTGPKVNEGSKMMLVATGEPRFELCRETPTSLPEGVRKAEVACGGCLLLEGPEYEGSENFKDQIRSHPSLEAFRLVLLVDSIEESTRSEMAFLWTWFTRFEPAADVTAASLTFERFHAVMEAPLIIDTRTKPWYPGRLVMHTDVRERVEAHSQRIFPDWS